ncbi:MAG TPA: hypothetical protein VL401_00245 [Alphaproteobacteria bacterium]|jgi:hypothetical protein|nr:hypothetical protein [Alphaproteobacteria bacterium]
MFKIFTYIFAAILLFVINVKNVSAQELVAGESAKLKVNSEETEFDFRVSNLKNFLEKHNSPLVEYADEFVNSADTYGIDYRLVPAISGVESTFGKHIPYKSYNAYGWANGEYKFTSWENSIDHVSKTLKLKYIDRGAPSIAKIARRYAPPSTTWGRNVGFFMTKIDSLPLTFDI